MVLTKDELVNIQCENKQINTPYGEVQIRPLTYREVSHIEQIRAVGTITITQKDHKTEETKNIDLTEYTQAQHQARLQAISYSLSVEEQWTNEDLEKLPVSLLTQLYDEIREYNNLQ